MLLGDKFDAQSALEWGLVHRVVADEDVAAEARVLARRLADGPTAAFAHVKSLIRAVAPGFPGRWRPRRTHRWSWVPRQIIEAQSRLSCRSRSRFSRAADFWCGERFSCVLGHLGAY